MGCNCKKDAISLSVKRDLRRRTKEKIAEVKRLWQESASNKVTANKDELGFK